jgi:hypothetical protein
MPGILQAIGSEANLRNVRARAPAKAVAQRDTGDTAEDRGQKSRDEAQGMSQNQVSGNDQQQLVRHWNADDPADQNEKDCGVAVLAYPKGQGLLKHWRVLRSFLGII